MVWKKMGNKFIAKILATAALLMVTIIFVLGQLGVWRVIDFRKNVFEITIIFVLMVTFIIAYFLARDIVQPLQNITRAAMRMAEGDLDQKIPVNSPDEAGILAQSLNRMAERLKENIDQITEEKNKLQAILSSMDEGVIAIDKRGTTLLINPVVENIFGIDNNRAQGKNIIEVIRNYQLEQLIKDALASEKPQIHEMFFLVPEKKLFRVYMTPLEKNGAVAGMVIILQDITELRRLENIRSQFVANVSHELRTPLTSIKGFVETLLDGAIEDQATANRFLNIINDETERLNRLISDILSLSRIESRRTEVVKVPLEIEEIIYNVADLLRPLSEQKGVLLGVNIRGDLPVIEADRDMIRQVVINLTENAIKYTNKNGQVLISATPQGTGVEVEVRDTGIGIPKDSLPRLFERFYRVDKARSREMGGTGLGLAIVKHIIEAHQGTIRVESELNKGSVFTFTLP